MMSSKAIKIVISVVVVAGALSYLLFSSFGSSMVYYKTVDELLGEPERFAGQPIRINGVLVPGSVRQKPGTDEFRFQLKKNDQALDVEYSGILPDAMQDGRELVVHGALQPNERRFVASEILTRCPSKYEAEAEAANR